MPCPSSKPNEAKSAIRFDRESVTEQLRCSGVLEAVRISRAGFPDRMASKDVVEKYGVIGRWQTRRNPATRAATITSDGLLHALSEKLRAVSTSPHAWFVGKTKIFFAAGILAALDRMKANTIGEAAAEVTRTFQALTKRRYAVFACQGCVKL
jgi:myosin V